MIREHEKIFNNVQISILTLIKTFLKCDLLEERMLCCRFFGPSVATYSFYYNCWSGVVDILDVSVESSANPVTFIEGISVVEAHGEQNPKLLF